ncbi:hypothetical protein L3X38_029614 [Prunus dulcis]|uniref:Uncharacterized protein n=1 Tax=Prunus dulcis TaxID=3755 RepID=A0AAD4Z2E2_PRUDU|nr:hypothetical protein L3X38_029614 [Prunus dulcis]
MYLTSATDCVLASRLRDGSCDLSWATRGGFSNNLFESFLDNYGEVGAHHVMEAAISGPGYQNLAVVD